MRNNFIKEPASAVTTALRPFIGHYFTRAGYWSSSSSSSSCAYFYETLSTATGQASSQLSVDTTLPDGWPPPTTPPTTPTTPPSRRFRYWSQRRRRSVAPSHLIVRSNKRVPYETTPLPPSIPRSGAILVVVDVVVVVGQRFPNHRVSLASKQTTTPPPPLGPPSAPPPPPRFAPHSLRKRCSFVSFDSVGRCFRANESRFERGGGISRS